VIGDIEKTWGGTTASGLSGRGGRSPPYWACYLEDKEGSRDQGKGGSWEEEACGGEG